MILLFSELNKIFLSKLMLGDFTYQGEDLSGLA